MKTPSAPAYPKIIEELRANPLERFSTIAARVGVSREYVRQVAARLGETAKDSIAARKAIRLPRLPSLRFCRAVRKWLREIGYDYCAFGRHVAPVADIFTRPNICREWFDVEEASPRVFDAYRAGRKLVLRNRRVEV